MLKKCNITKARNLYNKGITIFLVPCKVYPDFNAMWIRPFDINKSTVENEYAGYPDLIALYSFDSRVNNFSYYNCNSELGNYVHFYYEEG
jgi:hypothetical protein